MSGKGHQVSLWSMPGGCWLPWSLKPTEEMTVPSVISITVQCADVHTVYTSPVSSGYYIEAPFRYRTANFIILLSVKALYITKAQEVSQV